MEKVTQLLTLTFNDPNATSEEKKDFGHWLNHPGSCSGSGLPEDGRCHIDQGVDLRRQRKPGVGDLGQYGLMLPVGLGSLPPQVTISGVPSNYESGILRANTNLGIQGHESLSSLRISASRPYRSNSLTPPGCTNKPDWQPTFSPQSPKGRSHSLSYDHQLFTSIDNAYNVTEDDNIEELIRNLPEGSGMRELRDWLKSLRLHKYTKVLLEFTYEEFLDVTEDQLEKKGVTLGARGKILKNIGLIKQRPQKIVEILEIIDKNPKDMNLLSQVLRDVECFTLMPTKPFKSPPIITSGIATSGLISSALRASRHDSGSDSGTEVGTADDETSEVRHQDVPSLIFEVLQKVFTSVLVCDSTNLEVVASLASLMERCRCKESFTDEQKRLFTSWLQKMKALWNLPSIKKATEFKRSRNFRIEPARRPSMNTYLRAGPVGQFKLPYPPSSGMGHGSLNVPGSNGGPLSLTMNQVPEHPTDAPEFMVPFSPRRSMPEIKPVAMPFTKRNSYQEDRRVMINSGHKYHIDESGDDILRPTMDFSTGLNTFGLSSNYSSQTSIGNRRESTMSNDSGYMISLPESRRDSSLSTCGDFLGGQNSILDMRESSFSDHVSHFSTEGSALFPPMAPSLSTLNPPERRDSGLSMMNATGFCDDFLSVDRVSSLYYGFHGSISSGCVSDGSTDSLLEQDLHNLSLSVTQQALD